MWLRTARRAGFSLIELLVGIGLACVLAGVSVPVASSLMANYQLNCAADRVAFEIARARMQAVGQNVFVRLRVEGSSLVRERSQDGATYEVDGVVELPDGVEIGTGEEGYGPTFSRSGLAPHGTTMVVANRMGKKTLYTSVLGRVTIS
jgi:prepilin-type N-terminal cleavage/methylation domain-containing protein